MPALFCKLQAMLYLTTDTANQTLYLTLDEGRQYFTSSFTNYLLILTREENSTTGLDLAQVVTVVAENQRYTKVTCTTITLETPGRYRYVVYGQNSAVNLDPDDASVVGLVEQGWAMLTGSEEYYETPTIAISNDVIYTG